MIDPHSLKQRKIVYYFAKDFFQTSAKKRLAAGIGQSAAVGIYEELLKHCLCFTDSEEYERCLYLTPKVNSQFLQYLSWHERSYPQVGVHLGERMYNAFKAGQLKGYTHQIIIGTDAPGIGQKEIMQAFYAMEGADLVVSPSKDGGFSLIGLKNVVPNIFDHISWSSSQVLQQLIHLAKEKQLLCRMIASQDDIDEEKDLYEFLDRKHYYKDIVQLKKRIRKILDEKAFEYQDSISVIVPTYNEEYLIEKSLKLIGPQLRPQDELIVVDGYSHDKTFQIAKKFKAKVIQYSRGRSRQMNFASQVAKGNILLFLHADNYLQSGALDSLRKEVIQKNIIGGCFSQQIMAKNPVFRWIESSGNIRAKKTKIFYGDQGIFVKKGIFEKIGGYPEVDLFEDILFSKKLRSAGATTVMEEKIRISARSWQTHGIIMTSLRNWIIHILFALGVSPNRLKKLYPDIRNKEFKEFKDG